MSASPSSSTLKTFLEDRLMNEMIKPVVATYRRCVLVLDPFTSKVLSSCCRMHNVMDAGVLVVQNILVGREKMPDLAAIYFIEPTRKNVENLIADFATEAKYGSVHLYCTSRLKKEEMELIRGSKIIPRLKSLVELNVEFVANEARVFSFNHQGSIPALFWPKDDAALSKELAAMSLKLVSLLLTTEELPYIRYSSESKSGICKHLAEFLDADLAKTTAKIAGWKPSEKREKGTLLILDRSVDLISPLIHEFTYQALLQDVLKTDGELCFLPYAADAKKAFKDKYPPSSAGTRTPKETAQMVADLEQLRLKSTIVLSEDDELWLAYRHQHISVTNKQLGSELKAFKAKNKMAAYQLEKDKVEKDAAFFKAVKDLPKYQELIKLYAKHMDLAGYCSEQLNGRDFVDVGTLDQELAIGTTEDGGSPKDVKKQLANLCSKSTLSPLEKLRLVMLFLVTQGTQSIKSDTIAGLLAGVEPNIQRALDRLSAVGASAGKLVLSKGHVEDLKRREAEADAKQLSHLRWVPAVRHLMQQLASDKLPAAQFPYVGTAPEGKKGDKKRGGGRNWRQPDAKSGGGNDDSRPHLIVFVLGGVTHSEIRSMYEVAATSNVNLFIGSSTIMAPNDFLRDLAQLDKVAFKPTLDKSYKNPDADIDLLTAGLQDVAIEVADAKSGGGAPAKKKPAGAAPATKKLDDAYFD